MKLVLQNLRALDEALPYGRLFDWFLLIVSIGSMVYESIAISFGYVTISRALANSEQLYDPISWFGGAAAMALAIRLFRNRMSPVMWWCHLIWILSLVHVFWALK